jgi:hypothetical protein
MVTMVKCRVLAVPVELVPFPVELLPRREVLGLIISDVIPDTGVHSMVKIGE